MKFLVQLNIISMLLFNFAVQAFEFSDPFDSSLALAHKEDLEYLIVPQKELPANCKLATKYITAPIFNAGTNPYVTNMKQQIEFLRMMIFGNVEIKDIDVAMTSLYYAESSKNEVGIWVVKFITEMAAKTALQKSRHYIAFHKGPLLVSLWKDNEQGIECEKAIKKHLLSNKFNYIERKP